MIGVGIDRDATNAAIKAIQDVMDRNTTFDSYDKLNIDDNPFPRRELSILLGVPLPLSSEIPIRTQSSPSSVNVTVLLQKLFPNCHQKQSLPSIRVQVGGLNIQETNGSTTTDCGVGTSPVAALDNRIVVVAHLSFDIASTGGREFPCPQPKAALEVSTTMQQRSPTMEDNCTQEKDSCRTACSNSTIPHIEDNHRHVSAVNHQGMEANTSTPRKHTVAHGFRTAAVSSNALQRTESSSQSSTIVNVSKDQHLASNETVYNYQRDQPVKRNSLSSIDLLAQISASIIDDSHENGSISAKLREDLNPRVNINEQAKKRIDIPAVPTKPNRKTSMNKLPLHARTPKNHTRHFVQHSYQDYSQEIPPVIYENRTNTGSNSTVDGTPISTTSLPFPLKLHEALTTIEFDKKDNIFGWLPHGRSFKIHHQLDFASVILPQYFVMTKKSSFLRQLNLYGFRRISDGSYYHERFLRGMSFLCQSMQRQKVNGNGVRAAGNPDDEPNLAEYPICPPSQQLDTSYRVLSVKIPSNVSSLPLIEQTFSPVHGDTVQIRESGSSSGDNDDRASSGEYVAKDGNNIGIFLSSDDGNDCDDENDYNETGTVESSSSSSSPTHISSANGNNNMNVSCTQRNVTFPLKLQRILDQLERDGLTDIISWLPHGRAFIVHDVDRFVKNILPLHFSHSKYSSFQRQCHMYHFVRINHGPDKGAYYHHQLLRGRPDLSANIHRSRGNSNKNMIGGQRSLSNANNEPNLYLLPPLPAISS